MLQEAGLTLDNVVNTTVFVQDLGDFGTVNEIYGTYFHGGFPARSCVQIAALLIRRSEILREETSGGGAMEKSTDAKLFNKRQTA